MATLANIVATHLISVPLNVGTAGACVEIIPLRWGQSQGGTSIGSSPKTFSGGFSGQSIPEHKLFISLIISLHNMQIIQIWRIGTPISYSQITIVIMCL